MEGRGFGCGEQVCVSIPVFLSAHVLARLPGWVGGWFFHVCLFVFVVVVACFGFFGLFAWAGSECFALLSLTTSRSVISTAFKSNSPHLLPGSYGRRVSNPLVEWFHRNLTAADLERPRVPGGASRAPPAHRTPRHVLSARPRTQDAHEGSRRPPPPSTPPAAPRTPSPRRCPRL